MKNLKVCLLVVCLMFSACLFAGCDYQNSASNENNAPETTEKDTTSPSAIAFETLLQKYQIFVPTDFGEIYEYGNLYQEGVDYWLEKQFDLAEECLLKIDSEITTLGAMYPEDSAYIKETLGCLYIEMAEYNQAYDYLIDALVTMQDLYGKNTFYPNTVSVALCHYYYAIGDYEYCLKEIQTIRENTSEDLSYLGMDSTEYLALFMNAVLNDLEADIYVDQYKMEAAYDLYMKNFYLCEESVSEQDDDTFTTSLEIDVVVALADFYAHFTTEEKYCELADKAYDKALSLLEYYFDKHVAAKKAEILMKKGFFLANFVDTSEESRESMDQAIDIQESLYGTNGTFPGLVESYRIYAEYLGFVMNDEAGAVEYYQKAFNLCEHSYKHNHPETAKLYESIGRYYSNRLRMDEEANEFFLKGIEIYKNLLIENHPMVAEMCLELAANYRFLGDEDGYQEYLEKNKEIETKLGYSHMTALDDIQ